MDRKNVLVISGKDQKLTKDIHRFLRKIGLEPLEPQNRFLEGILDPHEVLQAAINAACAIVIVLAADDEAQRRYILNDDREDEIKLQHRWYIFDDDREEDQYPSCQPRLSVLFAAGVAFATRPDNTFLLKRGHLRPCSHFVGRRCVELGDTDEQRSAFIEMLRSVGCEIDLSSNKWVDVGDFSDPDIKDIYY